MCNCACVSCYILDSEWLRITSWCWPSSWWSREDVVSVFGQFFLLLLYILLEFPKQIKTVLFWGNLRPLPVTRVIPSGQSRGDHVISNFIFYFFGIFVRFLSWKTGLFLWEILRHSEVVRHFLKTSDNLFFFVTVCFLTFIAIIKGKGSFDKHKHVYNVFMWIIH